MRDCDVLIIGAGPTGLVLALWLQAQGVRVRIVDKADGPGSSSRAMAVQARTLELYRQLGLGDEIAAAGYRNPAVNLWVRGRQRARFSLEGAGTEVSPYPFVLILPQDEHERLLIARLETVGVQVERGVEFLSHEDQGDGVVSILRGPDGVESTCTAAFVAGCDGASSTLRHAIGAGFPGGTYSQLFYVADVRMRGPVANGEIHVALDDVDFLAVFPFGSEGSGRLVGTASGGTADDIAARDFEGVNRRVLDRLRLEVEQVNWFSTYRVHHRVADRYRSGRAFLLGDAAHIHSPAGGQGMNTGIGDAVNLAWKLAAVIRGDAPIGLLDSYEIERRAFALRLVQTTDRGFTFATAPGRLARFVRTRLIPRAVPLFVRFPAVREYMFRVISQTRIAYRRSPVNQGEAGTIRGGDRLPWVRSGESDNYRSLARIGWQAHVYGEARQPLVDWCELHGVPLEQFPWQDEHGDAGLLEDALYLLRPDGYVALASVTQDAAVLDEYLRARGMHLRAARTGEGG